MPGRSSTRVRCHERRRTFAMMRRWSSWLLEPWRTRVLWLSVAANMFCGALIAGHMLRARPHGPGVDGAIERLARDLAADDAARFRRVMATERPWFEQSRRVLDAARADLARSIAQDPWDEGVVRLHMVAFQARWLETYSRFGDGLVVALGTLSPDGRARVAYATLRGPR